MTWATWEANCLKCRHHALLKAGKLDFDARPCPEDTRRNHQGKRISPQGVLERMRSDWRCPAFAKATSGKPAREPATGGAR